MLSAMPIDALKRRIQGSAAAADRMPRFYVLGAGAVGKLYAAHLRREGHDVTLLLRTPQRRDEFINWARLSIKITEVYRQQLNAQPSLCCSGSDVPAGIEPWVARGIEAEVTDQGYKQGQQSSPSSRDAASSDQPQIERLLVTTKAYDTKNALSLIWHRLGSDSVIVLLGNGMGVAEEVLDYARRATSGIMHKAPSILLATTYLGCMSGSNGSFHSLHTGLGPTYIASEALPGTPPLPHKHVESTLGQLTRLPLDVRVVPLSEIRYLMARKLAVNAVINPITAILGCRNGELINSSDGRALISDLSREISLVFRSGSPELVHRGFSHADVEMAVLDTCRATALNRSSMLQDIVKGSRTEIDYISGYIAGLARKVGVDAPLTTQLWHLVKMRQRAHKIVQ